MDDRKILADVYRDFFNTSLVSDKVKEDKKENVIDENTLEYDIDELCLTYESKDLLKKIVNYMEKYSKNEEENYIPFNICIECTDKEKVSEIVELIKYYANKYNYVKSKSLKITSLINLDKIETVNELYNNGIVAFSNLNALLYNDNNFKAKFFHILNEKMTEKQITLIIDKKEEINSFLLNDDNVRDLFAFKLTYLKPNINDVYNDIIGKTVNINLDDEFKIRILDYITETYPKTNKEYTNYVRSLYDYISFNKKVPELEQIKSIDEVFKNLNELVGLKKVKSELNDLVDLITLKNKTKDDLKINNVNLHMVFLGNPGTGKTTVARMIADILFDLKYIKQNKLIEVSSKDLVAEYVGQTAIKTMSVVNKALGGILFIDEAYALASKNNDNSFNAEAIATLIKAMEDYRDNLVVIFAGYTKEMQDFLSSNSGIVSRIGYTLEFEDYTNEELKQIFSNMALKAGFVLEDGVFDRLDEIINENRNSKNFGNARFIRNVYEKTIINHASNTKDKKQKKILKTITKRDIKY